MASACRRAGRVLNEWLNICFVGHRLLRSVGILIHVRMMCVFVCIHIYMHVYQTYTGKPTRTSAHKHIHTNKHIYTRKHTHTCTYTLTHTHTHSLSHSLTGVHTHTHSLSLSPALSLKYTQPQFPHTYTYVPVPAHSETITLQCARNDPRTPNRTLSHIHFFFFDVDRIFFLSHILFLILIGFSFPLIFSHCNRNNQV